ncbi:hypothetical protein DPEC_G00034590 [Dallia pectoralis]|uniref:Uncharacterized protein n=1 Tax=Dallia pectoralis TaxID=75939 RepID=A0ACC2HDV2_DALPE|nr:hypothetical protein DPEC_G00034590 [Dallia pectoralis]
MTHRVAFIMIAVAWTLSILISFIPVQLNWHMAAEESPVGDVGNHSDPNCIANLNKTYAISSSLISFYIPVVIMVATYTKMYRIAQTQIRRISSLERAAEQAQNNQRPNVGAHENALKAAFKKETKVLKTLSIIMGVFVFCWLPFFVLNCMVPFCDPPCVNGTTFTIFVWFGWANSSLNPVIYAFNADFRKAFATILGCNKMCSSNTVEAVNFSNDLVSYHHDTTLQKDAQVITAAQHPQASPNLGEDTAIPQVDEISLLSNASRNHKNLLLPTVFHIQCDGDISLDTLTPITTGATECRPIPGQIPN